MICDAILVLCEIAGARYSFSLTIKLPLIPHRCRTSVIFISSLQSVILSGVISVMYLSLTFLLLASRNDFLIGSILLANKGRVCSIQVLTLCSALEKNWISLDRKSV